MGAVTATVKIELDAAPPKDPADRVVEKGVKKMIMGTFPGPASYDSGGSTIDLSNWLSGVPDIVMIDSPTGLTAKYVDGTTAANGKVKVFNSLPAHTHTINVTGGAAAAGTKAIYSDGGTGGALSKEEAGNITGVTGIQNNAVASTSSEVTAAVNLSTPVFGFIAVGDPK